jgi:hypothetical protein
LRYPSGLALQVSKAEYLRDVVVNIIMALAFRIILSILIHKALKGIVDSLDAQFVLIDGLLSLRIKLRPIEWGVCSLEVFLDLLVEGSLVDLKGDDLVRDHAKLLKSKGLNLRPGETLQDPRATFLFKAGDFPFNELNGECI